MFARILVLLLVAALPAWAESAGVGPKDSIVLIIRHAEKPDTGTGLSPAGEERAQAYVRYFQELSIEGSPVRPDVLFAGRDSKASVRPRLTIEPFAKAAGLAVDSRFRTTEPAKLAAAMRNLPPGKRILISWRHGDILPLLSALGVDSGSVLPKGKWPDAVFDWVIVLRFDKNGALIPGSPQRIKEHLMPGD